MYEHYEAELQLKAMEGQSGIVKFRYNTLLKRLSIRVYFRNKRISSRYFSIKTNEDFSFLEVVRNRKVVLYRELLVYSFCFSPIICAEDSNGVQIGKDLLGSRFKRYWSHETDDRIEKILVREKLKSLDK